MKIILWTGKSWEPWGPSSVDSGGIGGSETAAVHMGFELAKRGHEVVMFGDHDGKHEGWYSKTAGAAVYNVQPPVVGCVRYMHYQHAIDDPKLLACDVFVSSRDKTIRRLNPDAKVKVLWVHDVHVGDDWENDILAFDRVYCLTKWHKGYFEAMYPHVEPSKIGITRNGIDPARFEKLDWSKKIPSFVYSSSPDRGLDVLLDMWPKIKERRPEASLTIYYGFETWRRIAEQSRNKRGLAVIDFMQSRIEEARRHGVYYRGRVGQRELAEAHKNAAVWFYPTRFTETYCITALEAQAAGACVVSTKLAGLAETAATWPLIEGRNTSPEYQRSALDQVLLHLSGNAVDQGNPKAHSARNWALTQTWAGVAEEWERDFMALAEGK